MGVLLRTTIPALLALFALALAENAQPAQAEKDKQTLEKFGFDNKACHEWTNGCAVCRRRGDGTFACSLPGIACQPTELACRQEAKEQPKDQDQPQNPGDEPPRGNDPLSPPAK